VVQQQFQFAALAEQAGGSQVLAHLLQLGSAGCFEALLLAGEGLPLATEGFNFSGELAQGSLDAGNGQFGLFHALRGSAALGAGVVEFAADLADAVLQACQFGLADLLLCKNTSGQEAQQQAGQKAAPGHQALPLAALRAGRSRERPLISGGGVRPISSSRVGATSQSEPSPARSLQPWPTQISGTGPLVWEVMAWPFSGSSICSTLPWSAVIRQLPFSARVASTMRPRQASTTSTALMAAARMPVWPTMSPLAKLQTMASNFREWMASTSLSVTSGALISGFRS